MENKTKNDLLIACEDIALYYATNLRSNDKIEVSIIVNSKSAYNIKQDKILKIDYISSQGRVFLKCDSGYLEYGIPDRLASCRAAFDNCLKDFQLVKKIKTKEGVVKFGELINLQGYIDSTIKYEKEMQKRKDKKKIENDKEAFEAKKNYSYFGK